MAWGIEENGKLWDVAFVTRELAVQRLAEELAPEEAVSTFRIVRLKEEAHPPDPPTTEHLALATFVACASTGRALTPHEALKLPRWELDWMAREILHRTANKPPTGWGDEKIIEAVVWRRKRPLPNGRWDTVEKVASDVRVIVDDEVWQLYPRDSFVFKDPDGNTVGRAESGRLDPP